MGCVDQCTASSACLLVLDELTVCDITVWMY